VLCAVEPPTAAAVPTVEALIRELEPLGVRVIYSSQLVPPQLLAPAPREGRTPLQRVQDALAAHDLELRPIAPNQYVVARLSKEVPQPEPDGPLEEISVYASRYSLEGRDVLEARELTASEIESVPGSHDDALRALRALPGLATNASGRPYIRGSLADDVLVRYDGITLLDPFHLKNFQSLISAIDPAGVDSMEVFSGGFPVRYGTRSGGVIDIHAPTRSAGYENRVGASLISAGASTLGHADEWPLEWSFAIRRSTLDLLEPVEAELGKPQFSDSLGRLRWSTDNGVWSLGWLLLDDRIELGREEGDAEFANATYRDEYLWLARDHEFSPRLGTRVTAVLSSSNRHRTGSLLQPGVSNGSLDARLEFDRVELNNSWRLAPSADTHYSWGVEAAVSNADYLYSRRASYVPAVAAAFNRPASNDLDTQIGTDVVTYAAHGALRKRWSPVEVELGLRFDGQHYSLGGDHTQFSPRLNLRYDRSDRLRLYASVGRFSQAQHVEEWRVEEAQATADSAQVSIHSIAGFSYQPSDATQWGAEIYSKRWTTVAPYFDNRLDPLALLPELGPDRVRIAPARSEASGLELNLRHRLAPKLSTWATLGWARVADDMPEGDVRRSWDQPLALTAGLAWQDSRLDLSAWVGWHRGWPRTELSFATPDDAATEPILLGPRNEQRWKDFLTLDLRGSYTWLRPASEFSLVLEVTNTSNRDNQCCAVLQAAEAPGFFSADTDHWLPVIVNIGFTYRWTGGH